MYNVIVLELEDDDPSENFVANLQDLQDDDMALDTFTKSLKLWKLSHRMSHHVAADLDSW
jgi:hypothetical protein